MAETFLEALEKATEGPCENFVAADSLIEEFLHDILEDYRIILQREYDYQHSTEQSRSRSQSAPTNTNF